jgi:hypothetical protein
MMIQEGSKGEEGRRITIDPFSACENRRYSVVVLLYRGRVG